jgi:hypothetical protein
MSRRQTLSPKPQAPLVTAAARAGSLSPNHKESTGGRGFIPQDVLAEIKAFNILAIRSGLTDSIVAFLVENPELWIDHPKKKCPIQKRIADWNQTGKRRDDPTKFLKGLKKDCPTALQAPKAYHFLTKHGFKYDKKKLFMDSSEYRDPDSTDDDDDFSVHTPPA